MTKTILSTLVTITLASACAVDDAARPTDDPRDGVYTVQSEVEADAIASEIFRDGVLVAVASLDGDAGVVTLVESGKEMVAPRPEGYDPRAELERWEADVANMSTALELSEARPEADEVTFRMAEECGAYLWEGSNGSVCAYSWCGSSCWAFDCGPGWDGGGEIHVISSACGV